VLIRSGSDAGIVGSVIYGGRGDRVTLERRAHLCWASGDDAASESRSNTLRLSAVYSAVVISPGDEILVGRKVGLGRGKSDLTVGDNNVAM